ncbi:glycosyl hydrolase family 28-related protein [Streptomyces phaeochromogenes]
MSSTTTRLGMLKADGNENVNVLTQINNNFDAIDQNVGYRSCTSVTRPTTVWSGLSIRESDTGALYVSNGSSPASASWIQIPTGRGTNNWFNVTSYGALGDGVQDDTGFIQDAIDAASSAGGGVVYLPEGTYKLTATLALASNVWLKGDGITATIIQQTSTTEHAVTTNNVELVGLEDLMIDGPGSGTGQGIHMAGDTIIYTFYVTMRNVMVRQFGGTGIAIDDPVMVDLYNVTSKENGGEGFHIQCSDYGTVGTSTSLVACYSHNNTAGNGFRLTNMVYTSLTACGADFNVNGYKIEDSEVVVLNGCGAEVNSANGVQIVDGNCITVMGLWNGATPTGANCVQVTSGAQGVTLKGIKESGPSASANAFIKVDSGCQVTIENCYSDGTPNDLAPGTCSYPGGAKFARKTADETVTSSTTLQDDDHLALAVESGHTYDFKVFMLVDGGVTGDLKTAFTFPTGSTLHFTGRGPTTGLASGSGGDCEFNGRQSATSGSTTISFGTSGSRLGITLEGILIVGSTAGSFQLQWAQNTSDGTGTTLKAGSYIKLDKVA